jgi:phosphoglucosamine mutase
MSKIEFGTDGVRGRFNSTLRIEDILRLGLAHGHFLKDRQAPGRRPQVVVGRDSRVSGDALLGAYGAGLMSQGVDVIDIGVIPTPAVAFAVHHLGADGAAMMSASHNPVPDNGIKLFGHDGKKLNDGQARLLESLAATTDTLDLADGVGVGRLRRDESLSRAYRTFLLENLEGSLRGLKVVLDCAYGAAASHAEAVFIGAGAEVVTLHDEPDGERINVSCGSTDLSALKDAVRQHQADMGFAFDGDADRCLAVSEKGESITGDQMMVIVASELKKKGRLAGNRIVLTVMSNLGAELALKSQGISVVRTPVGDRYVFEEMSRSGAILGGEQSGHILLLDRHCSGDGMLAGLVFAGLIGEMGVPVSSLLEQIPEMPQKLINVSGVDKSKLSSDNVVLRAIEIAETRLGEDGRLLVRPSGTEPLVRLMAEGPDSELLDSVLDELRTVVVERLSL